MTRNKNDESTGASSKFAELTKRYGNERDADIGAAAAGGLGAVRKGFEHDVVYKRKWELGLDFSDGPSLYMLKDNIRSMAAEFCATALFLYYNITCITFLREGNVAAISNSDKLDSASRLMLAFSFSMSIFVLVYIFAGVSGANINPAVTFGLMVGRRMSVVRCALYVIAQIVGAIVGTAIAREMDIDLFNDASGGANIIATTVPKALGAEIMGTFVLVLCVLMATNGYMGSKIAHIPIHLPFGIGMSVFIAHCALIPIDGCSINPARSFGPAVVADVWKDQWVFWVGPFIGAGFATLSFEAFFRLAEPVPLPKQVEAEDAEAEAAEMAKVA